MNRFLRTPVLMFLSVLLLCGFAQPAAAQPAPPAFSANIDTVFPGAPFITCLQGQFEPQGVAHFWYIRARQSGTLTIQVRAFSVNAAEAGSITASLFDGANFITSVQVPHPLTAGAENVGSLSANVTAPAIYRLEVLRAIAPPGTPEAHHYKLGFSGLLVDVGVNSPTARSMEPDFQILQVNLGAGEPLSLQITPPDNPTPPADPQVTVEVGRRDLFPQVMFSQSAVLPLTVNLANPYGNLAGTLVVRIGSTNTHYILDKSSGVDRGIYFDTCAVPPPPPPPPVNAVARTIGYWKNHEQETTARLPIPLGNYFVDTFAKARAILDEAHAKNAYDMLAAQLLAARINVLTGVPTNCVNAAIEEANHMLVHAGYAGPGTTQAPGGADKEAVNAVKDVLDRFKNNGCP